MSEHTWAPSVVCLDARENLFLVGSIRVDHGKTESDERDPVQGVAPHVPRGVAGAPELCKWRSAARPSCVRSGQL